MDISMVSTIYIKTLCKFREKLYSQMIVFKINIEKSTIHKLFIF